MFKFLTYGVKKLFKTFNAKAFNHTHFAKKESNYEKKQNHKLLSNILIIDDDISCLNTLELLLKSESYNVLKAENGSSALHYLFNHPEKVDLILLDLMMPEISGFDILESLEKNIFLKNIPIIIQSGIIDNDIKLKISNSSVKGFIVKPYKKQELITTIDYIAAKLA